MRRLRFWPFSRTNTSFLIGCPKTAAIVQRIHKDISGLSIFSWLVTPFKIPPAHQGRPRPEYWRPFCDSIFSYRPSLAGPLLHAPRSCSNHGRRGICHMDICHCCSHLYLGCGETQMARLDVEEESIGKSAVDSQCWSLGVHIILRAIRINLY